MRARYSATRWVFLFLLLVCTQGSLFGQKLHDLSMFEPTITDGRAIALGHSSLLGTQNANNVFNNPSALANLSSRSLMLSTRFRTGESEIDWIAEYDSFTEEGTNTYTYKLHPKLNGVAFATPFKACSNKNMRLGLGFGYRPYYDWGHYLDVEYITDGEVDTSDMKKHGGFNLMSIAFGAAYKKLFNFGLSVNFPFASNATEEWSSETEIRTTGTFFVFGAMYNLTPSLLLSARLRTGFVLGYSEKRENYAWEYGEYFDVDYSIPAELGLALQYQSSGNLTLFLEVVSRFYDSYEQEIHVYSEAGNKPFDGADAGYSLRVGAEYGKKIQYRLGGYMQSVPVFDYDEEGDIADGSTQYGLTGGLGIPLSPKFLLDIYGDYATHAVERNRYYETQDITNTSFQFGCSLGYNY